MAMSYTKQKIHETLVLYMEVRSVTKVADITGIPAPTIESWRKKFNWDQKVAKKDDKASSDIQAIEKEVAVVSKELQLSPNDAELFGQVKCIEGICLDVIKGRKVKDGIMKPVNFDSAMRALKICWDARDKLFKKEGNNTPSGPQKISYVQNVYNQGANVEADTIPNLPREGVLSGQPFDAERTMDKESE